MRSIGVSNFTEAHLTRIIDETGVTPAVNQVELHPYFPQVRACAPCTSGSASAPSRGARSASGRRRSPSRPWPRAAERHGVTPGQVILRWQVQLGAVPIPKSATPERQRQNLDVFGFSLDARTRSTRSPRWAVPTAASSGATRTCTRSSERWRGATGFGTKPRTSAAECRRRRTCASTCRGCTATSTGWPARAARAAGVALRPHVKTHKTMEVARLQLAAGAVGHHRGDAGRGRDVRAPGRRRRVRGLPAVARRHLGRAAARPHRRTPRVAIGVDSVEGAANAGRLLGGLGRRGAGRGGLRPPPHRGRSRAGRRGRAGRAPRRARGARRLHVPGPQLRPGRHPLRRGRDEAHALATAAGTCAGSGSSRGWSAAAPRPAWRPA